MKDKQQTAVQCLVKELEIHHVFHDINLTTIKMQQTFVFVYAKYGKIKALNIEEAKSLQDELVKDGWVHTQTLDACVYIQYLHNDCEAVDLIDEMKSLTKRPS